MVHSFKALAAGPFSTRGTVANQPTSKSAWQLEKTCTSRQLQQVMGKRTNQFCVGKYSKKCSANLFFPIHHAIHHLPRHPGPKEKRLLTRRIRRWLVLPTLPRWIPHGSSGLHIFQGSFDHNNWDIRVGQHVAPHLTLAEKALYVLASPDNWLRGEMGVPIPFYLL